MDPSLPRPVRLRLAQVLAQWRRWSPRPDRAPEVIAPLAGGLSNASIHVGDGHREWVVRIDGVEPSRLGLNRHAERRALELAAAAGLAPRPVYHNPDLGALVCDYLTADAAATSSPEALGGLLRRIQALPPIRYRLEPMQRARLYQRRAGLDTLPETLIEVCDELARAPVPLALCHNDLLTANRLWSGSRLYALDWEYAAMGDPWFDLAVIAEGDALDDNDVEALHCAWLDRDPRTAESHRLELQRSVYRELSRLWELALPHCAVG